MPEPNISAKAKLPILIQRTVITHVRPSWQALVAYAALAYLAGDSDSRLGLNQLAELFSVAPMTLRKGIEELVQKRAVKIKRHARKKNGKAQHLPNEYILLDLPNTKLPI